MPSTASASHLDEFGLCPACGANWDGGGIFETLRPQEWCAKKSDEELQAYIDKYYGTRHKQHFSRLIGVEIPGGYDGVSYWQCPDCKSKWPREALA